MPRGALGPTIAVVALVGATWPVASHAQPREITLPRLEVPDEAKTKKSAPVPDRAALLNQPIELSDERDRVTLARERAAWGRLSGSLCTGCGAARGAGRIATVDPIAVLNAKPTSARPASAQPTLAVRPVRPATIVAVRPAPAPVVAGAGPVQIQARANPDAEPARPAARPGPVLVAAASGPTTARVIRRRPAFAARRLSRPAHTHRVQLAHRRGSRSHYAGYLGRIRYALLRWRHQHHQRHHRRRTLR